MGDYPYPIAGFLYAAFQGVAYAQFASHVLDIRRLAFVGEGGVAGDDKEAGDAGEICGEDFGDAVAEVVLFGIFAHVVEWQHDDRGLIGQG